MTSNRAGGPELMGRELQIWRAHAVRVILAVLSVAGLAAWGAPVLFALQTGDLSAVLWVYVVVYLGILVLALLPRVDFRVRALLLLVLLYSNAAASFARGGLAGSGRLYLLATPIAAILLMGARAGYLTAALSIAVYLLFTMLAGSGALATMLTLTENPRSLSYWIEAGLAFAVFLITVVVLLERFHALQMRALSARQEAVNQLEHTTEALREERERLNLVMLGANDGIWDWDIATQEVYFSSRWKSMLGYDDGEIENKISEWRRLLHPDDRQNAMRHLQRYLDGELPTFELEHRLRHKDGSYRWVLARGYAVRDSHGKAYRMAGSHTDITERRRVQEALSESEAEMRALLAAMTDVILVLDPQGRYLRIAPTNPALLVRPPSELVGRTLYDVFPQQQADAFMNAIKVATETDQPVSFEYVLLINGKEVFFWATVSPMPDDRVIWVARDVTEEKQGERALQERLAFEHLISTISTNFINLAPNQIHSGIASALEAVGRFYGADRACMFLSGFNDGDSLACTEEWRAEGAPPQSEAVREHTLEALPWLVERVRRLETVQAANIDELPEEAATDKASLRAQGTASVILVPMVYGGIALGFLGLDSAHPREVWATDMAPLLTIVGEVLANALEHQRARWELEQAYALLERRVQERTRDLATLNSIAAVVSQSLDLNEILDAAVHKMLDIMDMEVGAAYRIEPRTDGKDGREELYVAPLVYHGLSDEYVRAAVAFPLRGSHLEKAAATNAPVVWDVTESFSREQRPAMIREGVRQIVSVPLVAKGRLIGAIQMATGRQRTLKPEESALLAAVGQQIGVAVENARLYDQAEEAAAMAERSRLSRELHDSVTQSLYSVTLYAEATARQLDRGQTAEATGLLRELRDTAMEALREMRLLIFELRPHTLQAGLAGALQARLDAVESRGGLKPELHVEGQERLALGVQEELYHIAQEALNNVLKHACAGRVTVTLRYNDAGTYLEVRDDGQGFVAGETKQGAGLGLSGMRERAVKLGGTLNVRSVPGEGTVVCVELPPQPAVINGN